MLTIRAEARAECRDRVSRRRFLQIGALGGALTLADVLRLRAAAPPPGGSPPARSKSVIMVYLSGGPSHLDTYDLKPDAPDGMRSAFRPIATSVPGLDICEHFPRLARLADRFALVRSLNHTMSAHSDGQIEVMTGKTPLREDPTSQSIGDHPDIGHIVSQRRGPHPEGLPRYVALPQPLYATRPTYLGAAHQAFA